MRTRKSEERRLSLENRESKSQKRLMSKSVIEKRECREKRRRERERNIEKEIGRNRKENFRFSTPQSSGRNRK